VVGRIRCRFSTGGWDMVGSRAAKGRAGRPRQDSCRAGGGRAGAPAGGAVGGRPPPPRGGGGGLRPRDPPDRAAPGWGPGGGGGRVRGRVRRVLPERG